jgi:acyl-CoA thioesterase I
VQLVVCSSMHPKRLSKNRGWASEPLLPVRRPSVRVLWVFLLVVLAGCSSPDLEPLQPGSRVLAFGDSLTYGVGTTRENSYPAVLSQLAGLEVVNAGVSGETTAGGLARLGRELDESQPELLILLQGGNDILRNLDLAQTKANLAAMIELAAHRNIAVVLLGVPEKKLFSSAAPIYGELAEEHQLVFDGSLVASLLRSPSYKSDPVHLNAEGYRKMAESIHELLQDSGAL